MGRRKKIYGKKRKRTTPFNIIPEIQTKTPNKPIDEDITKEDIKKNIQQVTRPEYNPNISKTARYAASQFQNITSGRVNLPKITESVNLGENISAHSSVGGDVTFGGDKGFEIWRGYRKCADVGI